MDFGSKSYSLGINDLREIRVNGKKATRLCPCGHHGDPSGRCKCTQLRIDAYQNKISGPLLDRIDMVIEVPRLSHKELLGINHSSQKSEIVKEQVETCRCLRLEKRGKLNSALTTAELENYCKPDRNGAMILKQAMKKLQLSPRGYHRVLKISWTLADLKQESDIKESHVLEALSFRQR